MRRLAHPALGLGFVLLLMAAWQMVAANRLVLPVYLPGPVPVWAALARGFTVGDLALKLVETVARLLAGWLLASVLGVCLGLVIGLLPRLRDWVRPTLEFVRPLPAAAVVPAAIALFGLSDRMVVAVIAFGAIWPMLLGTVHGCAAVEPRLLEVAAVLRLSRREVAWKIALPSALPDILGGLRVGLGIALILTVVGEMLGGRDGLGYWILVAARNFRAADLYAAVVVLGLLGCVTTQVLAWAERRLIFRAGYARRVG